MPANIGSGHEPTGSRQSVEEHGRVELDEGKAHALECGKIHVKVGHLLERETHPECRQIAERPGMARREGPHLVLREGEDEAHSGRPWRRGGGGLEEGLIGERGPRHARQHRAFPATLSEAAGDACRADHLRGVDARHQAGTSRRCSVLARVDRGTVGREQARADLEMARAAFDQGVDRFEENLHALRGDGLGNARKLRVDLRWDGAFRRAVDLSRSGAQYRTKYRTRYRTRYRT